MNANGAQLGIVVAMAHHGAIGNAGKLPWHLPEDLKRFKAITMGHAMIMGRLTHESIGRALPGRRNIVVSRQEGAQWQGCEVAQNFEQAVAMARATDDMPMVIGGAQLYAQALPFATRLYVTYVDREVEADAFFSPIDFNAWVVTSTVEASTWVRFVDYERRTKT